MEFNNVEQPDLGSTDTTQAEPIESNAPQTETRQPNIFDLDQAERVKFQGKEMTPQELRSAYMAHSDYTRKTQALAQERKFMENLEADLDAIRQNPSLTEEFKRVYPQTYHKYLKYVADQAQTQSQRPNGVEAIPEVSQLKTQVQQLQDWYNKAQVQELETQFKSIFDTQIKSKYSWVDEDRLAGLAREAMQMGYQLRDEHGKVDATVLEQIAKYEHERLEKKFQDYQKQTVEKQRTASKAARDIGSGGGVPGQAPVKRTFKEATEAAIRDMEQRR